MNKFIRYGLLGTDKLRITSVKLPEDDLVYLKTLFPEPGFQTAIAGSLVAHFADFCRSKNVSTASERREKPELTLLSIAIESFCKESFNPPKDE